MPIADINSPERLVVLDLETSGLSPKLGHKIIEVAAVELLGDKLGQSFQSLINPQLQIESGITRLTGISNGMLATAPPATTILNKLHGFIGSSKIVIHNAPFDYRFIKSEFTELGLSCDYETICTLKLSREVVRGLSSYKLEKLAEHFRIAPPDHYHRAMADAVVTAHLFVTLMELSDASLAPKPRTLTDTYEVARDVDINKAEPHSSAPTAVDTKPVSTQDPRTFRELVDQIRGMEPRALTSDQYDDVVMLIDYMRDTTVTLYDRMCTRETQVEAREAAVAKRERELETKLRVFTSAIKVRDTVETLENDFGDNDSDVKCKRNVSEAPPAPPINLLQRLKSFFVRQPGHTEE